jgi:hypothetical protein
VGIQHTADSLEEGLGARLRQIARAVVKQGSCQSLDAFVPG